MSSKKVTVSNEDKGLTLQARLVPVVKFQRKNEMIRLVKETVEHKRVANALYDSVDSVFLTVTTTIGGARALRSGVSTITIRPGRVIDADSTEKTGYGKQQGIKKSYNPFRKGKASYHPILAFSAETKEILQGCLGYGWFG